MTAGHARAVAIAALAAGCGLIALVLASEHQEARTVWAIFGPLVGWSFVGTGLYASRRRPESRIGVLMIVLGFAWFLSILETANSPLVYTLALVTGGLWGGVFLHLGMSFPSGRLTSARDRALVLAGYVIFPGALVPALFFAGPQELDCADCPANLLLLRRDESLASVALAFGALLYVGLFAIVLARSIRRWRAASPHERLRLTPVYVCALLTFLLVTIARAGAGDAAWWAAFISSALLPFAFLGGLLRSHVSQLDAELRDRLEELRASRVRLVEAGDSERRRLERDLHDGAQSRLVGLALLLRSARTRAARDPELAALLDRAQAELQTSLGELRELARGIHPAVLTERGLEPALQALAARAPVPVELSAGGYGRLPGNVESATYFVVSEALANVAKYARATYATVAVRRLNGSVVVDVCDDGVGGADAAHGSGLRGLADRVAALDGTLAVESPEGQGTRLHAEIPCAPPPPAG
ncbi:MAG TPA: histidine kinase [Solirubrobacteraceae bacterium]|jgi:signal transduction histidine kinase|nr:histidine kinase [Solirubrobacteraceae bacterium]